MPKPKLLLISGLAPWPSTSGGAVRVLQTLEQLSQWYTIYFVSALEPNQDADEVLTRVKKLCATVVTFRKQTKKSHRSYFSRGVPFWFSEWYNPELALICRNLINQHAISLVQIETTQLLYLAPWLPKNCTTICVAYDVQLVSFWRRLAETKEWLTKLGKLLLLAQVWFYEWRWLPVFSKVVAVSTKDQAFFSRLYKLNNTLLVPNGYTPPSNFKKKTSKKFAIGFIGSTTHSPNAAALEYLLEKIAPTLSQSIGTFDVYIAGDASALNSDLFKKRTDYTVHQLGFLANVSEFYQHIDVLVAPLFSGSGTRIKIVESLAHNVPVVTTAIGAEGLEISQASTSVLLARSPETFVAHIAKIKRELQTAQVRAQTISQTWQAIFNDYHAWLVKHANKNQTPA